MKRFLLTSPNFDGELRLVYGPDNWVLGIDLTACQMRQNQLEYFLRRVPAVYTKESWMEAFGKAQLAVVVEDVAVSFDDFWEAYGLKRNRNRCEPLWKKMGTADRTKALHGLSAYTRHLQLNLWKNRADPDTYLRRRYWENDWK